MSKNILVVATLILASCGGSSGGGSAPSTTAPPPDQKTDGIWTGTVTRSGVVVNDIECVVAADSELACMLLVPNDSQIAGFATGDLTADQSTPEGGGTVFTTSGFALEDGSTMSQFGVVGGSVQTDQSLLVQIYVATSVDEINAQYSSLYDRGSDLSEIEGVYSQAEFSGQSTSFSIDSDGSLFSQTGAGCPIDGSLSVIDPEGLAYRAEVTLHCSSDRPMSGLAYTGDVNGMNDLIQIMLFDETGWAFIQALR